jgi:predicted glutamine amidotransferase
MCLIAYNPFGMKLNKGLMRTAYDNNPDGFGIVWLDDDNELSTIKDISDFKTLWTILGYLEGYYYSLHLRYRTKGEISVDQCHPFQVLNRKDHGRDMYLMHNGTIFGLNHKEKSDTQMFAEILREIYERKFFDRSVKDFYDFLDGGSETIGSFNRILLMTNNSIKILNKSEGISHDDVWYSNYYSFIKDYRKSQKEARRYSKAFEVIEENG